MKPLSIVLIIALIVNGLSLTCTIHSVESQTLINSTQLPKLQWSKTFGYIYGVSMVQNDANVVVAADSGTDWYYAGHGVYDYRNRTGALLKISLEGNVIWRKPLTLNPVNLIKTEDGGYASSGWTKKLAYVDQANGPAYSNFVSFVKTDSQGNIEWNQTYENLTQVVKPGIVPPVGPIFVNSVLQTYDGGFILGGYQFVNSWDDHAYRTWLMKTDSMGNMSWIKYYDMESGVYRAILYSLHNILETADHGFLFAGYLEGAIIVKTDSFGDIQWTKAYDNATFISLAKTRQGEFVFSGYQGQNDNVRNPGYLVKLDAAFNNIWNKTYEDYGPLAITDNNDEGCLFVQLDGGSVIKADLDGNVIWAYKSENVNYAIETNDGEYFSAGYTADPNAKGTMTSGDITDILVEKLVLNPSPSVPEILVWTILPLVAVAAIMIVYFKKRKRS
jgi:hypothetical protein